MRQGDGLEAGAATQVHGGAGAQPARDTQAFEERALLADLGLELAEHARVVLPQRRLVVVTGRPHGGGLIGRIMGHRCACTLPG